MYVEQPDYNTEISEVENKITTDQDHDKYIRTQEFNKLTTEHPSGKLAEANLASESDINNFLKKTKKFK